MTGPTVRPGLELLPCPFCGSLAWMHADGGVLADASVGYRVECQGRCHAMTCYWHAREEAITAWNTRALAASGIEEMRGALEAAADMCAVYADFIRNHVCADDIEIHPYLPALEDVIANGRAALSLADGMGGEG
jgi:Lar family restriction alleviation protein